jgi:hypothetical protein
MYALATDACLKLRARAGLRVECLAGRLWITSSGDVRDLFIAAGESAAIPPGMAVIEARAPSQVRVVRELRIG